MRFGRILVAVDFEPSAAKAVEVAQDLALRFASELGFVHVLDGSVTRSISALREEAIQHLASLAGTRPPRIWVEVGHPAVEIVRVAAERLIDLIVIGSRTTAPDTAPLGGIADAVVRRAPCAVLVVRG
jgi:nucleotide-binding universal stress UspA family protein